MGFHKSYKGLDQLPEVKELIDVFMERGYTFGYSEDMGMRMDYYPTEVHFIPETERLRLCIHDDGMGEEETDEAIKIAKSIVEKYGYKQGDEDSDEESEDEFYKYF